MIPQELKNYKFLKIKYNSLLDELEMLKARATKITSVLSDMPGTHNNDKLADCIARIVDTAQESANKLIELTKKEKEIKTKIEKLESPYSETLYNKYILDKTVAETSVAINYSYEQTKRLLKKGNKIYQNMTLNDLE